jgi:peptide/nickel transport system ATP-binding protein
VNRFSGKTLATRAIIGSAAAIRVTGRPILFKGRDVTAMSRPRLRAIARCRIGMVFQEPMTSLNPSMTIGRQLDEGLRCTTNSPGRAG